ncbi:unnamed protein product [Arctia plantaginis]|uniref:Uncharacterized protein n=1 Tax=Arctia plantaginis TaxID=874455 RepID=A0A8S1BJA1_ARCPL|nr:unnamed protein product [Arctia plantaginis]
MEAEVCIFEPTPLIHTAATTHGLEYRWVQTGKLVADGPITALSWNLEGTRATHGREDIAIMASGVALSR